MAEAGGTTTQSGIYYQNSIAALYLGRLIDSSRANEQTIDSIRVEAPEAVDDIVITYSNRVKEYIQAKERLSSSSEEWKKLWCSFKKQADICNTKGENYNLILAISNTDASIQGLKELCERAKGKENAEEWIDSLNTEQQKIVKKIEQPDILVDDVAIFDLLKNVEVKVIPFGDIESDYCPNWIPKSNVSHKNLFSHLRDMIGGYARIRRTFICSKLLEELLLAYDIEIPDSPNWGVDVYKQSLKNEYHVLTVPGTSLSGSIDELFMWPELHENILSEYQDFEFEDLSAWREIKPKDSFELKDFPNQEISQAVINAGAGLGKTTLLKAITYKLTQNKIIVPAFVPLSMLTETTSVMNFLNTTLNDAYEVNIDWNYMCSCGRVSIFFDGLDELSNTERQDVLDKIAKHIARFHQTSFLLTVRDSSILTTNLDVKLLEIKRLTDEKIIEFSKAYKKFGAKIDVEKLLEHTRHNSELIHLLRIPLFLALVLASFKPTEDLPSSRSEILERYLEILFSPEVYKTHQDKSNTTYLREATEYLAYMGLTKEHIGFSERDILKYLRILNYCDNPSAYLENLIKYGILSKTSSRLQFTYPTIQEYLASRYIVENNEEEIINGFEKIISRPWAQTIQFALESYQKSNEVIKSQLQKDDDAFYTSLRLIARCVINGATIDSETRIHLGELLADAWTSDSSSIAQSIGYLLLDGFTFSLPLKAEEYIIHGWGLNYGYGGAKILAVKKDKVLTEKVLINMLSKNIEYKPHLHDWQEAVDDIAEIALDLYINKALDKNTNEKEISTLHSLINNLNDSHISQSKWLEIVKNERIPSIIRLVVAMKIPSLVNKELSELYSTVKEEWMRLGEDYSNSFWFINLFWKMPECEFFDLIKKAVLTDEQIEKLLDRLFTSKMQEKYITLLLELYNSEFLTDNVKFKLNLLLSTREEFNDEIYAVEHLNYQNIENIILWCFLIGHLKRETALKGLNQLSLRDFNKEEFLNILSSLSTGLNYIMEPTLTWGGTLDKKYSHSALPEFSDWLIKKSLEYEYDHIEQINILDDISKISSGKLDYDIETLLNNIVSNYTPSGNEDDEKENEIVWSIRGSIYLCEREKVQLSEDCLIQIILLNKFNLTHPSLSQLVKIADRNTTLKLIEIYNSLSDYHTKGMFLETIEKLSSRIGFRVINFGGKLQIE